MLNISLIYCLLLVCNLYLHTTTHTSIVSNREDTQQKLNCGYIDLKIKIRQNWNNKDIEQEKAKTARL